MMSGPYQVPYQNQLQFNLEVPLAAQNLAVQYNRPSPIFVERVGGQHGIPSFASKKVSNLPKESGSSVCNYSMLSEDRMEMMSRLAQRDLRNRKLQSQLKGQSHSSESLSPTPAHLHGGQHQRHQCDRFTRQVTNKPRKPLTAKEGDKNRRFGAVQTPPPRKPRSHFKSGDDSFVFAASFNKADASLICLPAKPVIPEGSSVAGDEITKLQQEMEGYLALVEQMEERAISDPSAKFLHPAIKGRHKDEFLAEDESSDRVRVRVEEQNTRFIRNLYNLKQKVKQVQRDVAYADLNKPTKKSQICSQLNIVHRGAVKLIQTFVNQLPHKDLREGLPPRYQELASLLRQLTALNALTKQGKSSEGDGRLLAVLDRVDNLNSKWCLELKKMGSEGEKKAKTAAVTKDWVSDTKVDRNMFVMKSQPGLYNPTEGSKRATHQQQRGRTKKRASGKENRGCGPVRVDGGDSNELRSAITTLLQQKDGGTDIKAYSTRAGNMRGDLERSKHPRHVQDFRKGYLLPHDLIIKREKAQKAVALSKQEANFAGATVSSRLKRLPCRPNSAPASTSKHKEVNFDLDKQFPAPWIPPGRFSRSRSLSSEHMSRSVSSERRSRSLSSEPRSRSGSPFYLRDMDSKDVKHIFPGKHSLRMKKDHSNIRDVGFSSIPGDTKLRSADVSNSFVDEIEHRLLQRMLGRTQAGQLPERREKVFVDKTRETYSEADDPLDTTDLVETARREAVSAADAPTLENMKQRLAEMQREQTEIRQRWSSLKFTDTKVKSRLISSAAVQSEIFRDPPAIQVTRMSKTERPRHPQISEDNGWTVEPLIFTKSRNSPVVTYLHSMDHQHQQQEEALVGPVRPQKKLVTLKQTTVERISAERDRFESYLRKRSHHPSGKFDPWKLVEEISDEILWDCLADVASEVEMVNEEIANHMYKSEFMVDVSQSGTALQSEHSLSPQSQPMGDIVSASHEKLMSVDSAKEKGKRLWDGGDQQADKPEKLWESGDQRADSPEKLWDSEDQRVDSPEKLWDSGDQRADSPDKLWDSGDQQSDEPEKLWDSRDQRADSPEKSMSPGLSNGYSPVLGSSERRLSGLSATGTEPLLEDVSQLLHHREDAGEGLEDTGRQKVKVVKQDEEDGEDYDESLKDRGNGNTDNDDDGDDDDEVDDDKYELDDFEDDSDDDNGIN